MIPEFNLDPSSETSETTGVPLDNARLQELLNRRVEPEERDRLERLLLQRLKEKKPELEQTLEKMSSHWNYEDHFYRYYHVSFKVYRTQNTTEDAVRVLRGLLPERKLNMNFECIIREGTGKEFEMENDQGWNQPRSMLEAFAHAKFMIEMALRYSDLQQPPQTLPSGYAALLYLYDLR